MATMSEARKRDFVIQLILTLENQSEELSEAGYDPAKKLADLKQKSETAKEKEAKQQEAMAASKDATLEAQSSLADAYKEASATVDLLSGILGKDHNLVKEIRKMRK